MRHVFVSYCHEDADFVHVLKGQLEQSGFSVWNDGDLQAGDNWHSGIEAAVKNALAVVLVLSERAQTSPYVSFEWAFALGAGIPVLPLVLKISPDRLHPRLGTLQALDFSNYMLRPWDSLMRALRNLGEIERPFSVAVARDAPPFIQQLTRNLDSMDAEERIAAATTLAELQDSTALEVLAEAVRHPSSDVRDIAAEALAKAKDLRAIPAIFEAFQYGRFERLNFRTLSELGEEAVPILAGVLRDKSQPTIVREAIAYAFREMLNDESVEALHELLRDSERQLRIRALEGLAGHQLALPWILELIQDKDVTVAGEALESLVKYLDAEVTTVLTRELKNPVLRMRQSAAKTLAEREDATAAPALVDALRDPDSYVRARAKDALIKVADVSIAPTLLQMFEELPNKSYIADVLATIKGDTVVSEMRRFLKSEDVTLRTSAASALRAIRDTAAVPDLVLALTDEEEDVRRLAAYALGDLKDARAVPGLIAVLQRDDEFDDVKSAAAYALSDIGTREARIARRDWDRKNGKKSS